MKFGQTILVFLLTAAPLSAETASVKAKSPAPPKKAATGAAAKVKAPSKSTPLPQRSLPAPRPMVQSVPVSTRSVPRAVPVSTRPVPKAVPVTPRPVPKAVPFSTRPVPKAVPVATRSSRNASSSKSASTKKAPSRAPKEKQVPVIVPNHSEYIDISFPEPPGGKASTQEKPAAPAMKAEPVEEIPGWIPPSRAEEYQEAIAAAGRR